MSRAKVKAAAAVAAAQVRRNRCKIAAYAMVIKAGSSVHRQDEQPGSRKAKQAVRQFIRQS